MYLQIISGILQDVWINIITFWNMYVMPLELTTVGGSAPFVC